MALLGRSRKSEAGSRKPEGRVQRKLQFHCAEFGFAELAGVYPAKEEVRFVTFPLRGISSLFRLTRNFVVEYTPHSPPRVPYLRSLVFGLWSSAHKLRAQSTELRVRILLSDFGFRSLLFAQRSTLYASYPP